MESIMAIRREWVTPVTAGAFLLSAVTGVLIFFHVDSGANKFVHEWLSWVLLAGAGLHAAVNFRALQRHLATRRGQLLVGLFLLALAVSFVPVGGQTEPPFVAPLQALARVPLATVAQVAGLAPEQLLVELDKAGVKAESAQQSLADLVGPDRRRQVRVLGTLFGAGR
jgi:peptidoglycan/LPS O-acetylase OafA/YrhL